MKSELLTYFREMGCEIDADNPPKFCEGDAEMFLRNRALCKRCPGLEHCRENGYAAHFILTQDRSHARIALESCTLHRQYHAEREIERLFSESAIPPGLRMCRMENFVTTGLSKDIARAKSKAVAAAETGNSLVLAGTVGTGKTHLASAIAQEALTQGRSAFFISAIGYLLHLKSTFEKRQTERYIDMIDHVKQVDCLVIDDLGAENPTSWAVEQLYDILNARLERQKQTIVTTNFRDVRDLARHMEASPQAAARIASRLISMGWLIIEAEDYRAQRRREGHVHGGQYDG